MTSKNNDNRDTLIPDPEVWAIFRRSSMTIHRWSNDPKLGFPPIVKINKRNYRSARALEAFKERMASEGMRAVQNAAAKKTSEAMHTARMAAAKKVTVKKATKA